MNQIKLLLVSQNRLLTESLSNLLTHRYDFFCEGFFYSHFNPLLLKMRTFYPHILIWELESHDSVFFELLGVIRQRFSNVKILILARTDHKKLIGRLIKCGVNGILMNDAGGDELREATYSLRNGYDYYSKSISNYLVHVLSEQPDDKIQKPYKSALSKRETEILKLWGEGYTHAEIAESLHISIRTVESHKNHIMQKINLRTTVDLVKYAIRNNIISI